LEDFDWQDRRQAGKVASVPANPSYRDKRSRKSAPIDDPLQGLIFRDRCSCIQNASFMPHDMLEDRSGGVSKSLASKCLEAVLQVAMDQGIEYVSGEAVGLLWQETRCTGVKMRDGKEISAENVVLAMGPWTPGFLQKCGVAASIPCKVIGIIAISMKLDENEYRIYKYMPILAVPGIGNVSFGIIIIPKN
jgi:glycine/D-amino acid oxidase-like deaminating enzyme